MKRNSWFPEAFSISYQEQGKSPWCFWQGRSSLWVQVGSSGGGGTRELGHSIAPWQCHVPAGIGPPALPGVWARVHAPWGCSGRSKARAVPLWLLPVRLCWLATLLGAESKNPRRSFESLRNNKNFQVLLIFPHGNSNSPKVSPDTPAALRRRARRGAMLRMARQERLWLHT